MIKVSIVIPTYNRFKFLLNTIKSIQSQTYKNIEIIVVNDCSTESEYYNYNWNDVKIINLEKNTRHMFGYVCQAFVRNIGIKNSTGDYIAFCDDDDIWFPNKLELQLKFMEKNNCKMSSTEGLKGNGEYNENKIYKKYNETSYNGILQKFKRKNSKLLDNGYPEIWTYDLLSVHNCMICSSVIIHKDILDKINNFDNVAPPGEDYKCWLKALKHTNSVYVNEVCFYYDENHGYGNNY